MSGYVESTFVANNSTVEVEVEFDFPFPTAPAMVACLAGSSTSYKYGLLSVGLYKVNRSGFTLRFYNAGAGDREPSARWIAVG